MFRNYISIILVSAMSIWAFPLKAQFGTTLYSDPFDHLSADWEPIGIDDGSGSLEVSNGLLNINADENNVYGAYYAASSFAGHFEVVINFTDDDGIALGLFKDFGGEPSMDDYTMMTIVKNNEGAPVVSLTDRQRGEKDVLDNTNKVGDNRYRHTLDGNTFSVPFTGTAKKLRILRHAGQQFFHFFYAVEKEIDGRVFEDWIELSPSKEWGAPNASYYFGIFSVAGAVSVDQVEVSEMPLKDQDDTNTGFKATFRSYTWSGFTDSALVVTFGDAFPFRDEDRKFVFAHQTNNIPVWHLDNGALFSHGFYETWDDRGENGRNNILGCIEPMSDRLLAHSDVEVIEDNDVRKVVKWTYTIVNPQYKWPDFGDGVDRPEAVEYYYIYADGSILRKGQYTHKLDTDDFEAWFELAELIVIAGENQEPKALYETPSLSIHELGEEPLIFNNDERDEQFENGSRRMGAVALTAHVTDAPDLFYAFSDDRNTPETTTEGLSFSYEVTWHSREHNFGHWPVNKEPYFENNWCWNWSEWPQHVSHASFTGISTKADTDWSHLFDVRDDGRKVREMVMFMGLNEEGSSTTVEDKTNSWLFPGEVVMSNDSANFTDYSHKERIFTFEATKELPASYFEVTPKTKLFDPILRIQNWGSNDVFVNMNGRPLKRNEYVTFIDEDGELLVLIMGTYSNTVAVQVSSRPTISNIVTNVGQPLEVAVFPNPSEEGFVNIQLNNAAPATFTVFSLVGRKISSRRIQSGVHTLDTGELASGEYILRIEQNGGLSTHRLLVR
ncbi:MAG: T9SS type A sorting domain-containing protein [Bacteroidota bacterium]